MGVFPKQYFPGVRPLRVIGVHPSVKVCLQLFYRGVYLLSESDGVEFVLDSPVEAFTDAVCLRALGLDLGMVCGLLALILEWSMLPVIGSTSTNTGLIPFHHKAWVVATKLLRSGYNLPSYPQCLQCSNERQCSVGKQTKIWYFKIIT